ncbi:HdaA/DnaA family protein [Novosphingobium aquimarinum]|uniref:HdaA/DnaA family protein n=1 Tax=Novosphingobium aquimarinum TaxID=2682494 RepID=UPI0012EB2535|nr:ATPase [Novosphingobium aquimarinum]
MSQIALPLEPRNGAANRIVVGNANRRIVEAFAVAEDWPYRTAILHGPPRSGKSLLARWFVESGAGDALDDADTLADDEVFHRWNRGQETGRPLLLVCGARDGRWEVGLPDLASRLGAALRLEIGTPDEAMLADLIGVHAEMRGLVLDPSATQYLVPRCERSHVGVETLVAAIDRLSLERKHPATLAILREALAQTRGT